ncbi:hypothetical protein M407DRAFT_170676 [Tulasnella calospora MUT 4182]|uniref:Uncharacterized protein n=1 Tax=Tulasnella calospora MUT 4182 TaxID=1051891 RepID=A0A0C3QE10_9AGAM|nr:hypothetical protein M407DRAFT_170676 [Tulasnella calospora MUT 4182]
MVEPTICKFSNEIRAMEDGVQDQISIAILHSAMQLLRTCPLEIGRSWKPNCGGRF